MKYSSYGMLMHNVPPISFTVYDGQNSIYRLPHEAKGRLLPFSIFLYAHDSECRIRLDNNEYCVAPSEAMILPHNVRHDFSMPQSGRITWSHIFLTADSVPLMDLYQIPLLRNREESQALLDALTKINRLLRQPETTFYDSIGKGIEMQISIMEICKIMLNRATPLTESLPFGANSGFFKLLSYINTHIDEPYSLSKLSEIAELSPPMVRKLFRSHFDQTPIDYVIKRKLLAACQLLTEVDMSVGYAAKAVGYDDQMYFSKQFKKHLGASPSQYKSAVSKEATLHRKNG